MWLSVLNGPYCDAGRLGGLAIGIIKDRPERGKRFRSDGAEQRQRPGRVPPNL
jgi:hypothetical protein